MIEVPFLVFALLLPVVGQGERVEVFGVSLSVAGLWAMWNILVKGTLGVATTAIMAATTPRARRCSTGSSTCASRRCSSASPRS